MPEIVTVKAIMLLSLTLPFSSEGSSYSDIIPSAKALMLPVTISAILSIREVIVSTITSMNSLIAFETATSPVSMMQ